MKLKNQSKVAKASFRGKNITRYSGLNTVAKYMNRQNIVKSISTSFPTDWHNATKFGMSQILMAITLASISGVSRINKIAAFSGEGLVKTLLKLYKPRVLKAMHSVKEYVQAEYLGQQKIVLVYQYVCYSSILDLDAIGLHGLHKQRSTSEAWIAQVKGQAMAEATLTDNFWANGILWQLNVFAYNISVMTCLPDNRCARRKASLNGRDTRHLLIGLLQCLQYYKKWASD